MSTQRMLDRIPNAIPVGVGLLKGYEFVCNKRSKDGTGKGNLHKAENSEVWGVLYEIEEIDLLELDRVEGGYQRENVTVFFENDLVFAATYISNKITTALPDQKYLQHIIAGAVEHHLPEDTITQLKAIPTRNKPGSETTTQ